MKAANEHATVINLRSMEFALTASVSPGRRAAGQSAHGCFALGRPVMTNNSRLALIAAVVALGVASPALAQSFDPDAGTGNVISIGGQAVASPIKRTAANRQGLYAFAMVPPSQAFKDSNDPALTGGGSAGYNERVEHGY
jgi:hypothetical protein